MIKPIDEMTKEREVRLMEYDLLDDQTCDAEEWGFRYDDCTECPAFNDCMYIKIENEENKECDG